MELLYVLLGVYVESIRIFEFATLVKDLRKW